ncbi:MAG: hypothetical protein ABF449_08265 [Ethanoligenens sp.]
MIVQSIKHLDALKIQDDTTGTVYYGCNQEWYGTKWQRRSGCGPTTSTTILQYLYATRKNMVPTLQTKKLCLQCMEDVWQYVTPGPQGISSTQKLCKGLDAYAAAKSIRFQTDVLDIPRCRTKRPALSSVLSFIETALSKDVPVAFLNLHNGKEPALDAWHWVTIVSLEYESAGRTAFTGILDEGLRKNIDFAVWLRTTALGGGLVSFDFA